MVGRLLRNAACGSVLVWQMCSAQVSMSPLTAAEQKTVVGDASANPGPLAAGLSPSLDPAAVKIAMRKVADWQNVRIVNEPSQDWTFATLYMGLLAASRTLHEPAYHDTVMDVAEHYRWELGPRNGHADDQAIGQVYLSLYRESARRERIALLRAQFNQLMRTPDDPAKPVWWWCDALFMAPPVWAGLASATHDGRYLNYMDREWRITASQLWDPQEHLFSRDADYLGRREKNGRKVFWSRGNGWVMGGLVGVLEAMPKNDPRRAFYVEKFQEMAAAVAAIQGKDGLWRAGLLDADSYANPETSGSAFFVYAMAWGIHHGLLDCAKFAPVVERGWAGLLQHVYADGRLGDVQPVGEAPGAYSPSASYVFGVGAFLLAGSEICQGSDAIGASLHERK
jgi:unsaturated rhamnogalacturonyl hydrolase